jgi:hypothetical protein
VAKKVILGGGNTPGGLSKSRQARIRAWQERIRDPSLTVLLVLDLTGMFFAVPLAVRGLPLARVVGVTLILAAATIVVLVSHKPGARVAILLGLLAFAASQIFGGGWPSVARSIVRHSGEMIAWAALIWAVVHAVYAPGRITSQRLQGAVVVYLGAASLFAAAYGLVWTLTPGAFTNLHGSPDGDPATAELLYFSLTTLTTTGYGDILPVDPLARSLANLESVLGVFYLAITVTRLVTLELENRRR